MCAGAVGKAKLRQAGKSWKEWVETGNRRAKGGEGDERVGAERERVGAEREEEVVPIGKRSAKEGEGEERVGAERQVEVVPMREGGGG